MRTILLVAAGALASGALAGPVMAESRDELSGSPLVRGAFGLRATVPASSFGIKLYSLNQPVPEDGTAAAGGELRLIGQLETATDPAAQRVTHFGLAWQHRLSAHERLALSAEHGESSLFAAYPEAGDTRAAVAWTREWSGALRPSFTGSVFLGDETARDEGLRTLGRKYVGFTVGGQLNLFRDHAPYLAFQMRRSYYEGYAGAQNGTAVADTLTGTNALRSSDDQSRLAAGWRWQVQPHMSLEAGASFELGAPAAVDPGVTEGNRLFFGTRFDFR